MNRIAKLWWTAKGVGWGNLPRRLLHSWRVDTGQLRRRLDPSEFAEEAFRAQCAATGADQRRLWARRAEGFFPAPPAEVLAALSDQATWDAHVIDPAEEALTGEYLFFGRWYGRLGWPPDFNLDPVLDVHWPKGTHWLEQPDPLHPGRDVKFVWEASRFALAFCFARAYARSAEDRWAEAFWQMFDAWTEQNPPEQTIAWRCGQEMTFRLMALLFGAVTTLKSPAATEERLYALSRLAWQTGRHVSVNINQARMQGNNHAISEAVGLLTIGLLFPEFQQASSWRRGGQKILAGEVARQVYDDGSYVQHSLNYHRVMMDDLLWAIRLGQTHGHPPPADVLARFQRAADWLSEMIDPAGGRAPNYGNNDGGLVLPLSTCDYTDYRPVAQAAHYLLHQRRCFEPGPWDEKMLWLFGPKSLAAPVDAPTRKASFAAGKGGYYILRGPVSWAMVRCHTYRRRPGQADMLHLDLWYRGENVIRDAGSYMYNCEQPWRHYFRSTAAHNTLQLDDRDQMTKGPRFLWFEWPKAHLRHFETSPEGRVGYFEGEHFGYKHLPGRPVHRRSVCRIDDTYIVIDDLLGSDAHDVAIRWRLFPAQWQRDGNSFQAKVAGDEIRLAVTAPEGLHVELLSGRERPTPEGWESLYYGLRTPADTVIVRGRAALPATVVTLIGPAEAGWAVSGTSVETLSAVGVSGPGDEELIQNISRISGGRVRHE